MMRSFFATIISFVAVFLFLLGTGTVTVFSATVSPLPNVVIFYADDMGYGDLACQNPDAKLTTPRLDSLAAEGMRFTDAHSSSGVCSTSRYALLTGNYHWRRFHGIVDRFGKSVFEKDELTLPKMLKQKGYTTACVGKWHLGWDWKSLLKPEFQDIPPGNIDGSQFDWSRRIPDGPCDNGFDDYFGDDIINFPPYCWIDNDRVVVPPSIPSNIVAGADVKPLEGNWEFRPGPMVPDWDPYEVLPTVCRKAVAWVERQEKDKPFFLYVPYPSPHAPIIPNKEFVGKTQAGFYGDFVYQTDWVTGQILDALERKGFTDNTLVIFSSDNGPEQYAFERIRRTEHQSMGHLRGVKRDLWEGGHRVPFIVRWPGKVPANTVSDETINQVDIFATVAAVVGFTVPHNAAVDSYDLTALWKGQPVNSPLREATVQNTAANRYAIRQGNWMYVDAPTGAVSKEPEWYNTMFNYGPLPASGKNLLYDLKADIAQRNDVSAKNPEKVQELKSLLEKYRADGRSRP